VPIPDWGVSGVVESQAEGQDGRTTMCHKGVKSARKVRSVSRKDAEYQERHIQRETNDSERWRGTDIDARSYALEKRTRDVPYSKAQTPPRY
jgi:hypothetical protein